MLRLHTGPDDAGSRLMLVLPSATDPAHREPQCRISVMPLPLLAFPSDLDQVESGPISTRNHRALSLPYLRFDQRDSILRAGERQWRLSFASANDSRLRTSGGLTTEEDQETERLALTYRQGLASVGELSVEMPYLSRGGGFMDGLIRWWHANILHWQDPYRASQPDGRSVVSVPGASFGPASGLGDLSIFIKHPLGRFTVEGGVKLPTGRAGALLGSGGADVGVAAKGAWDLRRRITLHALLGAVAQGKGTALPGTRGWVHQEGLALTWQPNGRDLWTAQWAGEASATVTGVPGSDGTHRQLTFGYRRLIRQGQNLELYFNEDRDVFNGKWPEGANIAPDWTIGLAYTWRK